MELAAHVVFPGSILLLLSLCWRTAQLNPTKITKKLTVLPQLLTVSPGAPLFAQVVVGQIRSPHVPLHPPLVSPCKQDILLLRDPDLTFFHCPPFWFQCSCAASLNPEWPTLGPFCSLFPLPGWLSSHIFSRLAGL